ncbi:LOW QUALITY PROTEIN: hypothetical protein YC2023_036570 [Brassica napus]
METEAGTWKRKRSAEARFLKILGNGYVLEAFRKLPQGSDSDSSSEAGSGRPMKLPCNVGFFLVAFRVQEEIVVLIFEPNTYAHTSMAFIQGRYRSHQSDSSRIRTEENFHFFFNGSTKILDPPSFFSDSTPLA